MWYLFLEIWFWLLLAFALGWISCLAVTKVQTNASTAPTVTTNE